MRLVELFDGNDKTVYLLNDCIEILLWSERKAMQCGLSKGSAWWFLPRLSPIHPTQAALIMPPIRIFPIANNNSRV